MLHKSQIFFYILLSFIVSTFVGSLWHLSQTVALVLVIVSMGLITVFGYHKNFSSRGLFIGILLLFFSFGIIRFNHFNFSKGILNKFSDIKVKDSGIPFVLKGYIDSEPDISFSRAKYIFRVKQIVSAEKTINLDETVLLNTNKFPIFYFGDQLMARGVLSNPENFDDHFDYITYLKKQGIRTIISYPKIEKIESLKISRKERAKIFLYKNIFALKHKFENSVNLSVSEPNASYINGILLGSRKNIPDNLKDAFNRTSTTHILAISGYNITIIAEVLLSIFIFFVRRRVAFWISVLIIVLFTILTGASASVIRAAIMGLLVMFARGYGCLYDVKNSIALAGAIMIFVSPLVLNFDIGFQLSFLAVLGLVYLYPLLDSKFRKISNIAKIKETLLMSFSAQVFVFPVLIYHFRIFSLVSLPVNLLVLPFIPYAMLFGFVTGLVGLLWGSLARIVGIAAWAITSYQIKIIKYFGSLSFASLNVLINPFLVLLFYILLILVIYRYRKLLN